MKEKLKERKLTCSIQQRPKNKQGKDKGDWVNLVYFIDGNEAEKFIIICEKRFPDREFRIKDIVESEEEDLT